jgi:hypothetical protein
MTWRALSIRPYDKAAAVPAAADVNGEVGELEVTEQDAATEPDGTHNILVTGPPFAEAAATAAALADKYQVRVLSVDECVAAAAEAFSDVGPGRNRSRHIMRCHLI